MPGRRFSSADRTCRGISFRSRIRTATVDHDLIIQRVLHTVHCSPELYAAVRQASVMYGRASCLFSPITIVLVGMQAQCLDWADRGPDNQSNAEERRVLSQKMDPY